MVELPESVVIVGAGQAGCQLAESLRQQGYSGTLHLVGEESYPPYQRPPLSKRFLAGEVPPERLALRPPAFYEKNDIQLHLNAEVVQLDLESQALAMSNGERLSFDRLALCTGAQVFRLPVPGTDLGGVHYLRSIDDVELIRAELGRARRIVIIGAGFIGLETAAMLAQLGKCAEGSSVTVLESQDRVMVRAVSPPVSDFFHALHRQHGVNILLNHTAAEIRGDDKGHIQGLLLSNGEFLEADLCIIGAGVAPNIVLAAEAGLACQDGIVVDEYAVTSNPIVVAAGDCTRHPNALIGRDLRLESVHNAIEQAKTAAASIMGQRKPYRQQPWFWSDQYDVKLQMVGISHGYDTVVQRGNPEEKQFSLFYFRAGQLIAVDSINRPADHMQARRLLNEGIAISPEQAADLRVSLKDLQ